MRTTVLNQAALRDRVALRVRAGPSARGRDGDVEDPRLHAGIAGRGAAAEQELAHAVHHGDNHCGSKKNDT